LGKGLPFRNLFHPKFYVIGSSKVLITLHYDRYLDVVCNSESEKNLGVVRSVSEIQGAELRNFFLWGGVSITPNFLPRGSTNRQYFLSAGNLKRICIKHFLYIMALSVLVLELPGGRTFEFSAENF